jgi:hypothetical protein
MQATVSYDVFISHASEDKEGVARPLASALQGAGVQVWYDEFNLRIGDSLSESINAGLAQSRFGVIIISKRFLEKPWTRRELRGLTSREVSVGSKVILPVWHGISREDVMAISPPLADVLAVSTERGISHVAQQITEVVRPDLLSVPGATPNDNNHRRSLKGEYIVAGLNPEGGRYCGSAMITEHEGVMVIASTIGGRTYVCHGRLDGAKLKVVYGDLQVEYVLVGDGSLKGYWGSGGIETLTPIAPVGSKDPGTKGLGNRC